jgi:hypothetical protein
MRVKAGLVLAVLLWAGACGSNEPTEEPTKDASSSAADPTSEELVVAPGAIGPVMVGMTVEEANATGLFEPRETPDDDPCKEAYGPIQWKDPHTEDLMVGVDTKGPDKDTITVMGIRGSVETAKGVGVGSTLADVKAAYPDAKVEESQALGSTIYRRDGEKWLGIGFVETPDEMKDDSKVVFMEVTSGRKPATYLSGCSY